MPAIHRDARRRLFHEKEVRVQQADQLLHQFASTVDSLRFLAQLKNLEHLSFWECVDGDLTPVLKHPRLKHVDFYPENKHYTHKLGELQQQLAAKRAGSG